jgi:hypothetical protein
MAHIQHRPDRKNKPWKAIVHRVGRGTFSKSFAKRKDAELWGKAQDESIDRADVPLTISALKKVLVKDIVTKYRDEVMPSKGCHVSETAVLNRFPTMRAGRFVWALVLVPAALADRSRQGA